MSALLPCAAVGCGEAPPEPSRVEQWQAEADAHGAMGTPGTFRLEGAALLAVTDGERVGVVEAPLSLPSDFTFDGITVRGLSGAVRCGPVDVEEGALDLGVAASVASAPPNDTVLAFAAAGDAPPRAVGLRLPGGACTLFPVEGAAVALDEPFVADGHVRVPEVRLPRRVRVAAAELAVGGEAVGTARVGREVIEGATAVMGRDGAVFVGGGGVRGGARITQVLDATGPRIPAGLEAIVDAEADDGLALRTSPGAVARVLLHYRETSYAGDALLAAYEVSGPHADAVEIAAAPPDGAVAELVGALESSGPAAPIVAIVVVAALPIAVFVDVIDAIFGSNPPTPSPLPSYVPAGAVGSFSVVVTADDAPGLYEATLRIRGQNFDAVDVPLRWEVVPPAEP